jgi:hypothetical protein
MQQSQQALAVRRCRQACYGRSGTTAARINANDRSAHRVWQSGGTRRQKIADRGNESLEQSGLIGDLSVPIPEWFPVGLDKEHCWTDGNASAAGAALRAPKSTLLRRGPRTAKSAPHGQHAPPGDLRVLGPDSSPACDRPSGRRASSPYTAQGPTFGAETRRHAAGVLRSGACSALIASLPNKLSGRTGVVAPARPVDTEETAFDATDATVAPPRLRLVQSWLQRRASSATEGSPP